ncbi:spermidine hydroxycinnamoyl transferase-like [Quillaja saponaria]|uniref:Spermidine hydroxycinnamoyl transferase-like n=1 Tax=Quillaja saponaria TaxID=32244 RepID=A0AAD7VHZ2_QUISA|nr:spermidine hydroxycinnamoyl transferase-like [Quillaja saponaria]
MPNSEKMVTILSSHTVVPCELTPTGKFSLSNCDNIKLTSHAPLLYVYKPNKNGSLGNPIDTMRNSLSQALVHYYLLAGRLSCTEGGRLEVHFNSMGADLFEAFCQTGLDELGDFEPTQILQDLFPKIDYGCPTQEIPLLMVQLTSFPCGGLTVGVAISRAVVDGLSAMRFVNSWAKLSKGDKLDSSLLPFHNRTLLQSSKQHTKLRFDHVEFHPPPRWIGDSYSRTEQNVETSVAVLKITKHQIEKLKKEAMNINTNNKAMAPKRPYSSFEVISGHLWRCLCKAFYVGNGYQPTRLTILVNCRNRLKPPLPDGYFGNATFPTVTHTCQFNDLIDKPFSYAVCKIREAIEKMADEYVRSALDFIATQKDMNLVRTSFHYPEGYKDGNPNLFIVSWMNFPNNDSDFGWGNPIYMDPGSINSQGKVFIMQNCVEDGSLIIAICLKSTHINAFNKFFYEDIKEELPNSKL